MRRALIAANWKMNGSLDLVKHLMGPVREIVKLERAEVAIFPPALYVRDVQAALHGSGVHVGIQNVSEHESGAYTGDVSAAMAADVGCGFALVGHSERRELFGETGEEIVAKLQHIHDHGLTAVLCVGETSGQRERGVADQVVGRQLEEALSGLSPDRWPRTIVAYEPVWAIGTGKTASAGDAQAMHLVIRSLLREMGAPADSIRLLYGGSVKPDNAHELFSQPDIDGGLIGGASLKAEDFVEIIRSA